MCDDDQRGSQWSVDDRRAHDLRVHRSRDIEDPVSALLDRTYDDVSFRPRGIGQYENPHGVIIDGAEHAPTLGP